MLASTLVVRALWYTGAAKMKRTLSVVFAVWFFGAAIMLPYFNWQYAVEHGFMTWMFFGEIIPSAKALVWPYYAFKRVHDGKNAEPSTVLIRSRNEFTTFLNALRFSQQATKIINRGEEPTREIMAQIIQFEKKALAVGRAVDCNVLNSVYPELVLSHTR
ncbi:MAG: hypothetical protein NTW28_02785 [Candidatus Solibacter sp.]|nr:hypothetical protein [Candidatus Solibacter sp.]